MIICLSNVLALQNIHVNFAILGFYKNANH